MADSDSPKWDIPWTTIFTVLIAGAGAIFLYPSLTSSRPDVPSSVPAAKLGYEDVDARLWQDPFLAADTHRNAAVKAANGSEAAKDFSNDTKDPPTDAEKSREAEIHCVKTLRDQIQLQAAQGVQMLGVMECGAPYAEDAEDRLRLRRAVVEGLGACGLEPQQSGRIGYVEVPWPWQQLSEHENPPTEPSNAPTRLLVPYEWYQLNDAPHDPQVDSPSHSPASPDGTSAADPPPPTQVLVLWLQEEAFRDSPLYRLAALLRTLGLDHDARKTTPKTSVRIIGPRTSDGLRAMVREAAALAAQSASQPDTPPSTAPTTCEAPTVVALSAKDVKRSLSDVVVYSATATVADEILLADAKGVVAKEPPQKTVAALIEDAFAIRSLPTASCSQPKGLTFERTVMTDDRLMNELVKELFVRRHINLVDPSPVPAHPSVPEEAVRQYNSHLDCVAIISEWDTFYGRAMPVSFERSISQYSLNSLLSHPELVSWVWHFTYLQGLDGKIPGTANASEAKSGNEDKRKLPWNGDPPEPPEGMSQADSLVRVADQLERLNTFLVGQNGRGFAAVGVLGSDKYDKLLILKAIRPRLPGAIFFTTDMDARLISPLEWKETRNLLIASSFGLELFYSYQKNIAPFRDTYQTSIFYATLKAMGQVPPGTDLGSPRVFEVGRSGPYDLSVGSLGGTDLRPVHPGRYDTNSWWTPRRDGALAAGLFFIAASLVAIKLIARCRPWLRRFRVQQLTTAKVFLSVGAIGASILWEIKGSEFAGTAGAVVNWFLMDVWPNIPPAVTSIVIWGLLLAAVWLVWTKKKYLYDARSRIGRLIANGTLSIVLIPILAYLIVVALSSFQDENGQPLVWLDGISIWPTIAVRVAACLLAIHLLAKAWIEVEDNAKRIEKEFFDDEDSSAEHSGAPQAPPAQDSALGTGSRRNRHIARAPQVPPRPYSAPPLAQSAIPPQTTISGSGSSFFEFFSRLGSFEKWDVVDKSSDKVDVQKLWNLYRSKGSRANRMWRAAVASLFFYAIALLIVAIWGFPRPPARGDWATDCFNIVTYVFVGPLTFLLIFRMLDSMLLNRRFIRCVAESPNGVQWPPATLKKLKKYKIKATDCADLNEYLEIRLIAMRTDVAGKVVYYPLLVLLLLVASTNGFFCNWDWPLGVIIVCVLTALIAVAGALVLRNCAEGARTNALRSLRRKAVVDLMTGSLKQDRFKELISRIESEREGAFSLLSQYPTLAAILLPSGGLGIWALLQYFSNAS